MRKQWYYSHEGQKVVGPCSSAELRKLAATGKLMPSDTVRSARMVRPVKASRVRGLFITPTP